MHARNCKGRNGPIERPAINPPAQSRAHNMTHQTIPSEESTTYPGLGDADARFSRSLVPEAHRRAARQARTPALSMGMQSRPGQKRHLDDYAEEAEAEEPLHKRPRAKAARQADQDNSAHERTSGTTGREGHANKNAKAEQYSERGRRVCRDSTSEDHFGHQERSNLNMNPVNSSQDGMSEAKQGKKSADVESSSIAPLNIIRKSSGILQNSNSSRSILGPLKKKVRFEDEMPGKALEKPACLGNKFIETPKEQTAGSGSHVPNATQREALTQPDDADVIMLDVDTALSALSVLQSHH